LVRRGLGSGEIERLERFFFSELAVRGISRDKAKRRGYVDMFLREVEAWKAHYRDVSSEEAVNEILNVALPDLIDKILEVEAQYYRRVAVEELALLAPVKRESPVREFPVWLKRFKGLSYDDYLKLPEWKKEKIRREFGKWMERKLKYGVGF